MNLKNKSVVVTGASSGLGLFIARAFAERGARVFGLARSADKLDELENELGDAFVAVPCDVREEEQVRAAFKTIKEKVGRVDVLVNNAGLGRFGAVEELSVEDWDVQMETNLRGVFLCTRAAVPFMKEQNEADGFGGHIVNIASIAGIIGNPKLGAYNASKFGVRGLSESHMKELREDGIKVTCILPGSIQTSFADNSGSSGSANPMTAMDVTSTVLHVVESDDNYLISEVVMRPLRPRG